MKRRVFVGIRLNTVFKGDTIQPHHEWLPQVVESVTKTGVGETHLTFIGGGFFRAASDSVVQIEVWLSC